ncbi:ankyrin repeat domain-containing protein 29-like isoform X2 [Daphnia carinata]|uniref:ankyrin repeat domain-containing protein 29-like isoform X2 n=2 Tax=Daphnia carinata TaxID=120202 RepID=UPI00257DE6DA|nr:ankyrin repeat domain-containing protein 29-like isoform X2 [Daphnia carinata]
MRRWCVSRSLPSMSYKKESLSDVRLHSAARQGNVMDLRHLLESGKVHTDSRDKEGTTPLMMASAGGHFECCRELIKQGADPTLCRKTGAGSLFLAAQGGFNDIVNLLIRAGAQVNGRCKDGGTALMIAAQQGHAEICLELINSGADIHYQMKDGATCLFLAAQNGHAKVVSLILAIADSAKDSSALMAEEMINIRRLDGATALYMSAQMGFDYVVRLLLSAGANPNIVRNDGVSPLLKACQKGHVDAVRELLQANPSLELCQNGDSPLYAAVLRRDMPIIRILLKAGADAYLATSRSLLSPKTLAEKLHFWEIVDLLSAADSREASSSSSPILV